jgi:hypothetical protein
MRGGGWCGSLRDQEEERGLRGHPGRHTCFPPPSGPQLLQELTFAATRLVPSLQWLEATFGHSDQGTHDRKESERPSR